MNTIQNINGISLSNVNITSGGMNIYGASIQMSGGYGTMTSSTPSFGSFQFQQQLIEYNLFNNYIMNKINNFDQSVSFQDRIKVIQAITYFYFSYDLKRNAYTNINLHDVNCKISASKFVMKNIHNYMKIDTKNQYDYYYINQKISQIEYVFFVVTEEQGMAVAEKSLAVKLLQFE